MNITPKNKIEVGRKNSFLGSRRVGGSWGYQKKCYKTKIKFGEFAPVISVSVWALSSFYSSENQKYLKFHHLENSVYLL